MGTIQGLLQSVEREIRGIFTTVQGNSEENLHNRLRDGELVAIPVGIRFGHSSGHVVGALFLGDLFVRIDRGGDAPAISAGLTISGVRVSSMVASGSETRIVTKF